MSYPQADGNDDGADAEPRSPEGAEEARARSGDFSRDAFFDPDQLFEVIGGEESADHVSEAMRLFLLRGHATAFERAVAVFVRAARARSEPIEKVLATLIRLAEEREGPAHPHDWSLSDLRRVMLKGVLLAFYGDVVVAKGASESAERGRLARDPEEPEVDGTPAAG